MTQLALLYSFRRCPYAMRARLALAFSQQGVEVQEVDLKNKPADMLALSPKGTVPVLVLPTQQVIEESIEIVRWSFQQWLAQAPQQAEKYEDSFSQALTWISRCDRDFKPWLDQYKYAERFPEMSQAEYRQQAEGFIQDLEWQLQQNQFLVEDFATYADLGVMPFVRQFAAVEPQWWQTDAHYPKTKQWLQNWLNSPLFHQVMQKQS